MGIENFTRPDKEPDEGKELENSIETGKKRDGKGIRIELSENMSVDEINVAVEYINNNQGKSKEVILEELTNSGFGENQKKLIISYLESNEDQNDSNYVRVEFDDQNPLEIIKHRYLKGEWDNEFGARAVFPEKDD